MRIVAALSDPRGHYARLRAVFERSARATMPGIQIEVLSVPPQATRQHAMAACFLAAAERAIEIGEAVAVCDVDLMFLREIESGFELDFDVAVTVRETAMRYNTGLWLYRPAGAAFVRTWCLWTRAILGAPTSFRAELDRYGGIDQAALARAGAGGVVTRILELPCRIWNATQSEWPEVTAETRVIHVKSALRRAVLGLERPAPSLAPLVARFRAWEAP
jgi:hypothetical protein